MELTKGWYTKLGYLTKILNIESCISAWEAAAGLRLIDRQTFNLVKSPPEQINKLAYKYPAS